MKSDFVAVSLWELEIRPAATKRKFKHAQTFVNSISQQPLSWAVTSGAKKLTNHLGVRLLSRKMLCLLTMLTNNSSVVIADKGFSKVLLRWDSMNDVQSSLNITGQQQCRSMHAAARKKEEGRHCLVHFRRILQFWLEGGLEASMPMWIGKLHL